MQRRCAFLGILIALISFLWVNNCFSQSKDEQEDKAIQLRKLLPQKPPVYKLSSEVAFSSGYDNNVNLAPQKKGDIFEEFLYSLNFSRPWIHGIRFSFSYIFDDINYNAITKSSNMLNNLRFKIDKKISNFDIGTGCDLSAFYYPNNTDNDFFVYKGFFYVRNYLSNRFYHQLLAELGVRRHSSRDALADTSSTYQDKRLVDNRRSVEYSIGLAPTNKLFFKVRAKFLVNDSNARYQDYYDYKLFEISPSVDYKLTKDLEFIASFSRMFKDYKSRFVTLTTYKQEDDIYFVNTGFRFRLDKNDMLSLFYTYRDNSTPESLEKYNDSVITCGWQHNF